MNNPSVYDNCLKIKEDKKILDDNELSKKWQHFKDLYPIIYQSLILDDDLDLNILKYLCSAAEEYKKLDDDDKKLEFDINMGNHISNKFLYDKFPKPSNKEQEKIKETLKRKINDGTVQDIFKSNQ